jgi:hypothetical protein
MFSVTVELGSDMELATPQLYLRVQALVVSISCIRPGPNRFCFIGDYFRHTPGFYSDFRSERVSASRQTRLKRILCPHVPSLPATTYASLTWIGLWFLATRKFPQQGVENSQAPGGDDRHCGAFSRNGYRD